MQTDMYIFKYLLISIITLLPIYSIANNPVFTGTGIHTVQLHKTGWNQSIPVIHLNSQEELTLSFDEFAYDTKNYQYSIIHCDANWEESDLMQTEYVQGFMPNPVLDYQYSFNTTFDYIHYSVAFPNEDIQLKLSGNYIIKVFELGEEDKPILTRSFFVSESEVTIVPQIKYTASSSLKDTLMEVLNVMKPFEEKYQKQVPVIIGGGIYKGADIAEYIEAGASAVQMSTRFVRHRGMRCGTGIQRYVYQGAKRRR